MVRKGTLRRGPMGGAAIARGAAVDVGASGVPVPRRVPPAHGRYVNSSTQAAFATPHADLEHRCGRNPSTEGSNPSPSAKKRDFLRRDAGRVLIQARPGR